MGGFEPIGGPGGAIVDDSEPVGDPGRIWFDTSPSDGVEMKLADESGWTLIGKIPDNQVNSFDYSDAGFGQLDKFEPLGELAQDAFVDSSSPEHDPGRIWFDSSPSSGVDVNVANDTGWTLVGQIPYVSETAPSAEFSSSPTEPTTDDDVSFSADNHENVSSYTIDYDDNRQLNNRTDLSSIPNHNYANTGDYEPELTLKNENGMTVSYSVSIGVVEATPDFSVDSSSVESSSPYYAGTDANNLDVSTTISNAGGDDKAAIALINTGSNNVVSSMTQSISSGESATPTLSYTNYSTGNESYKIGVAKNPETDSAANDGWEYKSVSDIEDNYGWHSKGSEFNITWEHPLDLTINSTNIYKYTTDGGLARTRVEVTTSIENRADEGVKPGGTWADIYDSDGTEHGFSTSFKDEYYFLEYYDPISANTTETGINGSGNVLDDIDVGRVVVTGDKDHINDDTEYL